MLGQQLRCPHPVPAVLGLSLEVNRSCVAPVVGNLYSVPTASAPAWPGPGCRRQWRRWEPQTPPRTLSIACTSEEKPRWLREWKFCWEWNFKKLFAFTLVFRPLFVSTLEHDTVWVTSENCEDFTLLPSQTWLLLSPKTRFLKEQSNLSSWWQTLKLLLISENTWGSCVRSHNCKLVVKMYKFSSYE